MHFELTEQHKMLRKAVRDFTAQEIAPIAQDIDKSGELPWNCVRKIAKLGVLGTLLPPVFGGTGPDRLGFLIAMEEIAAASAGFALALGTSCSLSSMILALGNDEQKVKYLPGLANGERLGAMAVIEPSGGANFPLTMQSTARLEGESYVLNGTKSFISNAGEADIYLVLARTDPQKGPMGISGLIVEKGTPGFHISKREDKLGLRCNVTCELVFEDCKIPKANLLAESIMMSIAAEMSLVGLPAFGAIAVGLAGAALEAAIEYAKQRAVAFGQTLANFDGIQSTIAEMATLVEASRLLVYQAGSLPDDQADLTPAMMAGIFPCETALEVTSRALQILGCYGYTTDFPLERYLRDARGLTLVAQPLEIRKLFMGRLRLGLPPMGGPPPGGGAAGPKQH